MSAVVEVTRPASMQLARGLVQQFAMVRMEQLSGVKRHLSSGFETLDEQIPGWLHEGHLIVVAGRPGMGKSAFSQQIAEAVAGKKRTAIIYSLEMSAHEIIERSVSRRARVSIPVLKTGFELGDPDHAAVAAALAQFEEFPVFIDDMTADISEIADKAKGTAAWLSTAGLPPLGCIIIDYLQLVGAKGANRNLEIGVITRTLKLLAMSLSVPIIALSQLNRAVETRPDRRPTLADLRDGGSIEQDADLTIYVYRDEMYNPKSKDVGIAELGTLKNRHGPQPIVRLGFEGEFVTFSDLAGGAKCTPPANGTKPSAEQVIGKSRVARKSRIELCDEI